MFRHLCVEWRDEGRRKKDRKREVRRERDRDQQRQGEREHPPERSVPVNMEEKCEVLHEL